MAEGHLGCLLGLLLVRPNLDRLGLGDGGWGKQIFILDRVWRCSGSKVGGLVALMGKRKL